MSLPPAPVMSGPAFDRDPSEAYTWLRAHAPVYRLDLPGGAWTWLVTRFEDVQAAFTDPRLSKLYADASPQWHRANLGLPFDLRPGLIGQLTNFDGAEHQRLRRACAPAFSPGRIQGMRTRVTELAAALLDDLDTDGVFDLVGGYAAPLGITSICELIGFAPGDFAALHHPARVIAEGDLSDLPGLARATDELEELCRGAVRHRRAHPGPDLVSTLLAGPLTEDEVVATAFVMLIAGHETTVSLIASTMLALLTDPAARAYADTRLKDLIEEVLRRETPIQNTTWRFVTEPLELGGQRLSPGDPVLLSLMSAHHDPDVYPDPAALRPGERPRHLAFGTGAHVCIGAALARAQTLAAVTALRDRLPGLSLAEPAEELRWWPNAITRGLVRLPVRLE